MAKALQADAREELLRKADEAVFVRRNAAVELERKIKENELNTEIAVEQKKRQIRETQMEADVAVEEQAQPTGGSPVENDREGSGDARPVLRATLGAAQGHRLADAHGGIGGGMNAKSLVAMAFRDLADNAEKIGQLNISPDLLNALLAPEGKR